LRLIILILILVAGLLLRLDNAWQGSERNLPDSAAYERIARGLHEHGEFAQHGPGTPAHPQPATNYSPGLPLLTAGLYELTGREDVRDARILLALISALSIPLAWRIAARLAPEGLGSWAQVTAAAVAAFYPTVISDTGMLLTEPLAGTLLAGAVLTILRAQGSARIRDWAPPGILLGLTALVRPEYLPISLLVGAAVLLTGAGRAAGAEGAAGIAARARAGAAPAATMVAAAAVVLAPWMAFAFGEAGRPVPVSTGGGQTLFTGSVLASGGDPQRVMPQLLAEHPRVAARIERQNRASGEGPDSITPERVFALLADREHPGDPVDVALTRMGRENYLDALRTEPLGLAGFLAAKSARVWWRGRSDLTGTIPGQASHWAITGLALAGLVLLALRRRDEFWVIIALTAGATAIGAILVASPRRSLVLWPLIAALAGLGATGVIELARAGLARRTRPLPVA